MNVASLRKIQIVAYFDIRNDKGDLVAEGSLTNQDGSPHVIDVFAGNLREYLDSGGGLDEFIEASKIQLLMQSAPPVEPPPPSSPNRSQRRATPPREKRQGRPSPS
jgi:hypothetical protein